MSLKLFFKFSFFSPLWALFAVITSTEGLSNEEETPTYGTSPTSVFKIFVEYEDEGSKSDRREILSGNDDDLDGFILRSPKDLSVAKVLVPNPEELTEPEQSTMPTLVPKRAKLIEARQPPKKPNLSTLGRKPRFEDNIFDARNFNSMSNKELSLFWLEETITAALEIKSKQEPDYLVTMSKALGKRLRGFASEKEQIICSREQLIQHAYSLIFAMKAYYSAVNYVAESAYCMGSLTAAGDSCCSAASISAQDAALRAIDWSSIWDNRWDAIASTDWLQTAEAEQSYSWDLGGEAVWSDARNFAQILVFRAINLELKRSGMIASSEELGSFAYLVAEKSSLLYFLRDFRKIFGSAYSTALHEMEIDFDDNILSSRENLLDYKARVYEDLREDAKHFVADLFNELERIQWLLSNKPGNW